MPRFYFDFHDDLGITIDDEGHDLADVNAARSEAQRTIAEASRDLMSRDGEGQIVLLVRDGERTVFRLTATFRIEQGEQQSQNIMTY